MKTGKTERKMLLHQLEQLMLKGNAHAPFEDAVKNLPVSKRTEIPHNLPYSIWQLVEHIRIAQWDILEFSRNPKHNSPKWPEEYWRKNPERVKDEDWKRLLDQIKKDRNDFINLLRNPINDIYKPFGHGDGQNLLREALLLADHTSYHTGEIITIRRLLNCWK